MRDLVTPFFLEQKTPITAYSFPGTVSNKTNIDYFFEFNGKTLSSTGVCAEGYPNAILSLGKCRVLRPNGSRIDPSSNSKCLTANIGFYVNKTTGKVGNCYRNGKSCIGELYSDCLSGLPYYFFTKNTFDHLKTGRCSSCHTDCLSGTGPSI